MNAKFFLFEFGSTSLKFHFRTFEGGPIQAAKVPWQIAWEVERTGSISRKSIDQAVFDVQAILARYGAGCDPDAVLAFATGVFREAKNILEFLVQVWMRAGIKVRVISGDQEAALLKALFLGRNPPDRAFAFDLGSGSLQWVFHAGAGSCERGSVRVGVVRLLRSASDDRGSFVTGYGYYLARQHLSGIPAAKPDVMVGTGGTVRAIAKTLGAESFGRRAIEDLIARVSRDGPPAGLKPHRVPLFLPGLVLVHTLLKELGGDEIRYEKLSVGEALLEKVLPFYGEDSSPHPTKVWQKIRFSEILPLAGAG